MKIGSRVLIGCIALLMTAFIGFLKTEIDRIEIPKDGKEAILFSNQTRSDLTKTYVSAINSAKKSILVMIYSITDKQVIHALRQKSEEGVEITLICHDEISYHLEKRIGNKVKILKRAGPGLMHLKIMVVDDHLTFIGSANMTGASLKMHGNLAMAFESSLLSAHMIEKALSLGLNKNTKEVQKKNLIIGEQLVEVFFLPDEKTADFRIKQLIREAKKTIRVAMFTFTREDFAKELIAASLKGVDVNVALDNSSSKGCCFKIFEILNKSTVSLKVNKGPGLLHHKFLYIDGSILVNGSANWTKNAFNANDDCFVILHQLTHDQSLQMDNLWEAIIADSV